MAFSCNDVIFLQMEKSEVGSWESGGVRSQESRAILSLEKESERNFTPLKGTRKPFHAFKRFLGSKRPIGLIQRLVYRAPKNEGSTIRKCAPINTVVSVLPLQNYCLRIKLSRYRGKRKIKMSSKGISCGRVVVDCIRGALWFITSRTARLIALSVRCGCLCQRWGLRSITVSKSIYHENCMQWGERAFNLDYYACKQFGLYCHLRVV